MFLYTIETDRLIIREFNEKDFKSVHIYASKAANAIINFGFEKLNLHRILQRVTHTTLDNKGYGKNRDEYYSGENQHSLYKEQFFINWNQWIAVMEDTIILNRTYHHIALKISDSDVESYMNKIKELNLELKLPRKREHGEGYSIYFYDYENNLFELHTETLEKRLRVYTSLDSV
jgi:fosfomycin resistance protein FosX